MPGPKETVNIQPSLKLSIEYARPMSGMAPTLGVEATQCRVNVWQTGVEPPSGRYDKIRGVLAHGLSALS